MTRGIYFCIRTGQMRQGREVHERSQHQRRLSGILSGIFWSTTGLIEQRTRLEVCMLRYIFMFNVTSKLLRWLVIIAVPNLSIRQPPGQVIAQETKTKNFKLDSKAYLVFILAACHSRNERERDRYDLYFPCNSDKRRNHGACLTAICLYLNAW